MKGGSSSSSKEKEQEIKEQLGKNAVASGDYLQDQSGTKAVSNEYWNVIETLHQKEGDFDPTAEYRGQLHDNPRRDRATPAWIHERLWSVWHREDTEAERDLKKASGHLMTTSRPADAEMEKKTARTPTPDEASSRLQECKIRKIDIRGELSFGFDIDKSGVITEVEGPSKDGGMDVGDQIVAVNGNKVETMDAIRNIVAPIKGGDPKTTFLFLKKSPEGKAIQSKDGDEDDEEAAWQISAEQMAEGMAERRAIEAEQGAIEAERQEAEEDRLEAGMSNASSDAGSGSGTGSSYSVASGSASGEPEAGSGSSSLLVAPESPPARVKSGKTPAASVRFNLAPPRRSSGGPNPRFRSSPAPTPRRTVPWHREMDSGDGHEEVRWNIKDGGDVVHPRDPASSGPFDTPVKGRSWQTETMKDIMKNTADSDMMDLMILKRDAGVDEDEEDEHNADRRRAEYGALYGTKWVSPYNEKDWEELVRELSDE